MGRLDDVLRAALRDMAQEARPADLAQAAIAQARRSVRYRLARRVAGFAVVLAAITASTAVAVTTGASDRGTLAATVLYYSDGTTVLAELGGAGVGLDGPTGLVADHVLSELSASASSPMRGRTWAQLRGAGLRVVTTIDVRAQREIERVVDPAGPVLAGQPRDLQPAAVMVEPGTGRVLAYYGGADGTGADFAGTYVDESGEMAGFGRWPPGGSFQVHTLAAALRAGYSLNSTWYAESRDMPGRTGDNRVRNTSTCPGGGEICTLADSTLAGLNTTFYAVTVSLGAATVLDLARDAGIDAMWDDQLRRVDLAGRASDEVVPSRFGAELGLGQYPVTVLDQANAMATYAAGGIRARAHFVRSVWQGDGPLWTEALPTADQAPIMTEAALADLHWALSRAGAGRVDGHDSAGKTGSWQYGNSMVDNAHAWMVGYTRQLAMAVWVGDPEGGPIHDADGRVIYGADLPAAIYRETMTTTHTALGLPSLPFPPPVFAGDTNPPGSG